MLVVFFAMLIGMFSLVTVPSAMSKVTTAQASAYSVYNLIDRVPDIDVYDESGLKPASIEGNLSFKNVKFNYPTRADVPILKDLSLDVNAGKTVAFVGPSGSGKSTSVSLVQRFYNPLSGDVFLDGKPLREYNLQWLRQQIGVVG